MGRDRRRRYDDDDDRDRSRPNRPPRKQRNKYLLPILLLVGVGLIGLVVVICCGGYFLFGVDKSSDPIKAQNTLDAMGDVQMPMGLKPYETTEQITGVVSVEFRSPSGRSFLKFTTGSKFSLSHPGTLRESRDRGRVAGGGRPETPISEENIPATVRGQTAGYICQRYSTTEAVKGFFLGKQYPVHLEGELDLSEFPAGTAAAFVPTIR